MSKQAMQAALKATEVVYRCDREKMREEILKALCDVENILQDAIADEWIEADNQITENCLALRKSVEERLRATNNMYRAAGIPE